MVSPLLAVVVPAQKDPWQQGCLRFPLWSPLGQLLARLGQLLLRPVQTHRLAPRRGQSPVVKAEAEVGARVEGGKVEGKPQGLLGLVAGGWAAAASASASGVAWPREAALQRRLRYQWVTGWMQEPS